MKTCIYFTLIIFLFSCNKQIYRYTLPEIDTKITLEDSHEFYNRISENTTIKDLESKNLNYIVFNKYSNGSIYLNTSQKDNCFQDSNNEFIVIWLENNISYIQKFNNCYQYNYTIISNELIDYILKNLNEIETERVKRFSENNISIHILSHSTFKNLFFNINNKKFYNRFDEFDLKNFDDQLNINYNFNKNLKIVHLDKLIEKTINNVEFIKK